MQQQLAGLLAHANKQARAAEEEEEEEEIETESIYGDNDPKLLLLILLSSSSLSPSSLQFLASILLRGPNPRSPVVSMSSSVTRLSSSPPPSSPDAEFRLAGFGGRRWIGYFFPFYMLGTGGTGGGKGCCKAHRVMCHK